MAIALVYQYWKHAKPKEVIATSVASFRQNLIGDYEIFTCGDYYDGLKQINSPRICNGQFQRRFKRALPKHLTRDFDKVIKLQAAIDCKRVSDDFIRLYDDHFLLQPTEVSQLGNPVSRLRQFDFEKEKSHSKSIWQTLRVQSYQALKDRGLPTYRFATHNAIRYNKDKAQRMIDDFKLFETPLLFEAIYQNLYYDDLNIQPSNQKQFAFITCINDLIGCTLDQCRLVCVQNNGISKTLQHVRECLVLRPEYVI